MISLKRPCSFQRSKPIIPGYGTFPWPFARKGIKYTDLARMAEESIQNALTLGYRHLDTAFTYRNQDQVGSAIKASGISRENVYVASKLHQNNNNYKEARQKILEAIKIIWGTSGNYALSYLDCFMIHYPGAGRPLEAWQAMREARQEGLVKHIGVSNFEISHLEKIKDSFGKYPEINQIEFHPWIYSQQVDLVKFCKQKGIIVEGYSPLAQGKRLKTDTVIRLAEQHKTTPARVILKWSMQHGVKPIIGSRNIEHMRSNIEQYDFELSDQEMKMMNDISDRYHIRISEQWNWNPKLASFGD